MFRPSTLLALLLPIGAVASPLTVYDQVDLNGTGIAIPLIFDVYSASQIPGSLDNKISSFRLDAGHMAVVADLSSGLGPGKTYIADGEDLIVNTLPAKLDNALSFIRIVPWKATKKKGTGGDLSDDPSVDASWYYRWGYDVPRGQAIDSREYAPMSWGAGGARDDAILDYLAMDQVTNLLGFNESDNCNDQSGQFNNLCDVPTAVGVYQNLQKAGLRLGSPAPREEGAGNPTRWLSRFIDQSEAADIRIDFVALHWYDWGSSPAANPNAPASAIFERFKRYLSNAYHLYRRPLWITEFNANPNRGTAIQNEFMELALPYLESIGYVERYAWFQPFGGNGDFFNEGQLTSTGQIYKDQISTPAYASETLPSLWQNQDVGNVASPGKTIHTNGTYTVSGAGTGIGATADAFHYAYQPLIGDASIVARVEALLPRGDSKAGLMIRETFDAGSKHASIFLSEAGEALFEYRSSINGNTETTTQAGIQAPHWLKVERQGDTLTGFYSADAQSWTQLSSQSISMDATVFVGAAVSSQDGITFCDTIFKDLAVVVDSDYDQLLDTWELAYFGDLTTATGGTSNYDRDAYTDREEFIVGTDPTDPKSFFRPSVTRADEGYLEITFDGVSGLNYTLEVSESLSPDSWIPVDSVTLGLNGLQTLDHADPDNPSALFGRIKVEN